MNSIAWFECRLVVLSFVLYYLYKLHRSRNTPGSHVFAHLKGTNYGLLCAFRLLFVTVVSGFRLSILLACASLSVNIGLCVAL